MLHHRQRMGLGALVMLVLALALPGAALADGPTLRATTATIEAGRQIEFVGSGFQEGERVSTWATAPTQAVLSGPYVFADGPEGIISIVFSVPGDAPGGRWAFTAYGDEGKALVITTFDVVGPPADEAELLARVAPTAGPPGTLFLFAASGFKEHELLSYWLTGPDGRVFASYPEGEGSNKEGRVDFRWQSPETAPRGGWVMTVQGLRSGVARAVRFEIT